MAETIAIFLIGFIPGLFSIAIMRKVLARSRHQFTAVSSDSIARVRYHQAYLQSGDYHYIEGLGYMIGDLTCRFNARSAYLRCAVNPAGPCNGCPCYESIEFKELKSE